MSNIRESSIAMRACGNSHRKITVTKPIIVINGPAAPTTLHGEMRMKRREERRK